MSFTNPDFPSQIFSTVGELKEAFSRREQVEKDLAKKVCEDESVVRVTATIIPSSGDELEKRVLLLEKRMGEISQDLLESKEKKPSINKDGLPVGMVLTGESKGTPHTLEIMDKGYLCSTGEIAETLSAAAEQVSGNRRSGWAFWKDGEGTPIGEITGRFEKSGVRDPFGAL